VTQVAIVREETKVLDPHRERLAEDDPGSLMVRTEILDSWRRSKLNGVDPDHVCTVEGDANLDSRIAKVAIPVLNSAADTLVGANTSLLLSAPDGSLLWRWDGDGKLKKRLDRSNVYLGTRMSEDVVGTNGLGTALETARAVTVSGPEHFTEAFHDFTCAGAPIRHPVTNRVTGVLSVTSLVEDASPLMAPTLLRLARDIEEELYGETTTHERQMLRHFLAERRRTRSAVLAVSADVVIANAIATAMDLDHLALWQRIEDQPEDVIGHELAVGTRVTLCRPVHRGTELVGAVVVAEQGRGEPAAPSSRRGRAAPVKRAEDPPWTRIVAEVRRASAAADRLLVVGEDGVGKRTALRAALADQGGYRELDCVTVTEVGSEAWLASARALLGHDAELRVLAHLDALDPATMRSLSTMFDAMRRQPGGVRVAATVSAGAWHGGSLPRLILDRFPPEVVEIPPLRKRVDDVLGRLVDQGIGMPSLTREALQLVQRHPWPGNYRQLEEFRRWLARQERPTVSAEDLPAAWRSELGRGHLTAMQVAEAEAISNALRDNRGNKAAAAQALGISRSGLYRKMREYRLR
jgi:transcriptional regulator of acetoin/glycerol metabolism